MVAKTIHSESYRSNKIFLAVNCGALTESLLEAELFGHKKGAFTGAVENREGCFETAVGGTLFLDEIGEMPISSQVKLLRVLQEREVTRVGESLPRPINVRLIAASNKNLSRLVKEGKFREDLYYRLHVVELNVPPLRERKEDIHDLISHFIARFNKEYNKNIEGCSPNAMELFSNYNWPGNIRELRNAIEGAFAMGEGQSLSLNDLPPELRGEYDEFDTPFVSQSLDPEKIKIEQALKQAKGRKSKAAEILGISRATLWRKMREMQIH